MTFEEEYEKLKVEHLKRLQELRKKYPNEAGLDGRYSHEAFELNRTFFLPELEKLKKKYSKD